MKKALFLFLFSLLTLAGCAREAGNQNFSDAPAPKAVIRSGRKDPLLKSEYVFKKLGKPEVKRYEAPSEVWVYPQKGCVLLIYMTKQPDESLLVRHMEIGTPTFNSKEKDSVPCLRAAAKLR